MRLASFLYQGRETFGAVLGDSLLRFSPTWTDRYPDLRSLLGAPSIPHEELLATGERVDIADVCFRPVISNPAKIVCVGLNYRDHIGETGRQNSPYPVLFLRLPSSQVGHLEPLVRPHASTQLDYEGELAVVIGRPGRYIPRAKALRHVAGYSIYNEASIRDWQKHTHQYTAGKNFPGTGAFGPWLVTAAEIPDPSVLELTTRLNGQVMQQGRVADLIFPIDELIAYISTITELVAGDVLVTGTPAGVGGLRKPPIWMQPGDLVEVEIQGIGVLRNPVVQEPDPTRSNEGENPR
jgi:2-keto-4-pentenoate hydratase/2-oxohepta-3-ene-1,7-dioic acid hydratase in catechol pathway